MLFYKRLKKIIARKTRAFRASLPKWLYFHKKPNYSALDSNVKKTHQHYNPLLPYKIAIHTGESQMAISHINLWHNTFASAGIDFLIVTRHHVAFSQIIDSYPESSVVLAQTESEIKKLLCQNTSLKAVFYPSNTGNNIHLLNHNLIQHIFIGHGDSDKSASAHKFFRVYDSVWVAGKAHYDRFVNAGFQFKNLNFTHIGRPQLKSQILESDRPWLNRYDKLNILILPTWEGVYEEQDYCSLAILLEVISQLKKSFDANINVKLHPSSGNRINNFKSIASNLTGCTVHPATKPIPELVAENNIYICDISAVVSEVLAGGCPIFLYKPNKKQIKISSSKMPYEEYCYIHDSPQELVENITAVVETQDTLEADRIKAKEYILGATATLNNDFHTQIENIINTE